jgi:hypothetical protein
MNITTIIIFLLITTFIILLGKHTSHPKNESAQTIHSKSRIRVYINHKFEGYI